MIICKSWEKQVLDNTIKIKEVDGKVGLVKDDILEVNSDISEINQQMAKTLKTPLQRPDDTELVAVDSTNSQSMIKVGDGLEIKNGFLNALATGDTPNYNYIPNPIEFEFFNGSETDNPWYGPENTSYKPNFVQPDLLTDYLGAVFNDTNKNCEAKIVFHDSYGDPSYPNIATIYIANYATSTSVMDRGDYGSMGSFTFGLERDGRSGNWKLYCYASYGVQPVIDGVFLGEKYDKANTHPDLLS